MTSPFASGGGGTHFESRVVAYYLSGVLAEAPVRGLPAASASEIRTQRAAFGAPLDDLIVTGLTAGGATAALHLQAKSDLTFTAADEEWKAVVKQAWATVQGRFDPDLDRVGVAVRLYSARADRHYQSVLKWAAQSVDAAHFFERIEKEDFSHKDMRTFVSSVRSIIESLEGSPISDDQLWGLLRCFVILHFDLDVEGSRDEAFAVERLRLLLAVEERSTAGSIWAHLFEKAGEIVPTGGGTNRAALAESLANVGFSIGASPSFAADIAAVDGASTRALSDIKSDIHGLRLHRGELRDKLEAALSDGRFIQIDGEPGTGKSALLRELAEECRRTGPVFVLKDMRIEPRGWTAQAQTLGIRPDPTALLRELGAAGEPILFIDGIDKITDPATQLTVNDLVKVVAAEPTLAAWKFVVSVREQNLDHIATWLDPRALDALPVRTVTVEPLDESELAVVADTFPRLKPLLSEADGADVILRRPFFLESILTLAGKTGRQQLPATEAELLRLWWELGGSERSKAADAQRRRNALLLLAAGFLNSGGQGTAIAAIEPEPLEELKSAGVIRDKELGHSVVFTHDIYEEWALCELLLGKLQEISAFLTASGEPQYLIRPLQLLGTYLLETSTDQVAWLDLHKAVSALALRPVWSRATLTSCLKSTRSTDLLEKIGPWLCADDYTQLRRLLVALRTLEVVPNPIFLNEKTIPGLEPEMRVKMAHHAAIPKILIWVRFLNWFMAQPGSPWPTLLADLLPVFQTWQNAAAGHRIRHCRAIGLVACAWLTEFEAAIHPDELRGLRQPYGLDFAEGKRDLEKEIRALFLASTGDVTAETKAYLEAQAASKFSHVTRREIIKNSAAVARYAPAALVDYLLKVVLKSPDEHEGRSHYSRRDITRLGMEDPHGFYPSSPLQQPFMTLLRTNEAEGRRLIRELSNHSVRVWLWDARTPEWQRRPGVNPIPVELQFAWGKQTFWGDGRVYAWFRGNWANNAVASALMALEQWALEQVDQGRPFVEVLQIVLEGNESAAVLGIAVSLCLAYPKASIEHVAPFLTSAHIWLWDIPRAAQESATPANEIGNWYQDQHYLEAVRALNRKPHRTRDIRTFVPYFVFSEDTALVKRYTKAVRAFPKKLPFELEEQRRHKDFRLELREKMQLFSEQADPQFWSQQPAPDGVHIMLVNEPPSLKSEKHLQQQREHAALNEALALMMWAQKSLEGEAVLDRFTISDGIERTRNLDRDDLFDTPLDIDNFLDHQTKTAVAAVAALVARYVYGPDWDTSASWCYSVLERAAGMPEAQDGLSFRGSHLSTHPVTYAVDGFSSLLARGHRVDESRLGILNLACDSADGVRAAVAREAGRYAEKEPAFYWVLFDLSIRLCIAPDRRYPEDHEMAWDEHEATQKLALIERAQDALTSAAAPELPRLPTPWLKAEAAGLAEAGETDGYVLNDDVFLTHAAESTVLQVNLDAILQDPAQRVQFLRLVDDLVSVTAQLIMPPFAERKRDYDGDRPFEWIFAFARWAGRLAARLTPDEVQQHLLGPALTSPAEVRLDFMEGMMPGFMIEAFLTRVPDGNRLLVWERMCAWAFGSPHGPHSSDDHIERDFYPCALATLFCVRQDFGPLLCGVDEGWPHLHRFKDIVERAALRFGRHKNLFAAVSLFLKRGGFDLMPDPGLLWLLEIASDLKADTAFWSANGDEVVELLKLLLDRKSEMLTPGHRATIALISDILIDNGVRGAGFLQQDQLRDPSS